MSIIHRLNLLIRLFLIWVIDHFPKKTKPGLPVVVMPKTKPPANPKYKMALTEGYDWNPFKKYPRNESCYCGSGKKYKNCCIDTEPMAIPKESAAKAKELVETIARYREIS